MSWLSDLVKGWFGGGKGTSQVGSKNRSNSGVTVSDTNGPVVIGDGNSVYVASREEKKEQLSPIVRVQPALMNHPIHGIVHFLTITLSNRTDRSLFIRNVILETEKQNLIVPQDCATGEPQKKRELRAGDSFTFHIDVKTLREIGIPATGYVAAAVEDVVGAPYRSETKILQDTIAELLQEQQ